MLVAVVAGAGLYLASPWGHALVLRTVAAIVQAKLGVDARAAGLDYRVTSAGVTLLGVSVTQPGATRPFLTAERVDVDFLPGILLGRVAFQRLEVARPQIVLDPASRATRAVTRTSTRPVTLPAFDIRRVDLRDLTLTSTSSPDTQVAVRGLSLALDGEGPGRLRGEAVVSGGLSVQYAGVDVRFERARADLSLAGTSLSLASITTDSPVATIGATVRLDVSRGDVEAKYDSRIDVGQLRQWWSDAPPLDGAVEAVGTVGGTLDNPVVTLAGRGERLQWSGVTDATVSASLRWSDGDLVLDQYDVWSKDRGVRLHGRARVGVAGEGRSSSLRVEARADDSTRFASLIGVPPLPAVALTLVADLTWPGAVPSAATVGGTLKMAALDSDPQGTPIAALEGNGRDGRWIVQQRGALPGDTRVDADMSLVVDATTLSHSKVDGRVVVQSANLSAALRDLGRRGVALENVGSAFLGGRVTAEATLAGTLALPRLAVTATADSLAIAGIDQVRAEAQVRVEGRSASISRMTVESSTNRLDLSGTAILGTGPLDLTVDARFERPETLAVWLPAHWRPSGSLVLSGKLVGTSHEPKLAARISGSRLEANGIRVDTLETGLTFERGLLRVSDLRLGRADGWLRLDGDIDRSLTHMNLRARGQNLALSVRELEGAGPVRVDDLSVEIDVAGPPAQPVGNVAAAAGNVAVKERALGPVTLSAESSGRDVRFDLALPNHRADVTGSIELADGWPFDARATLRESQIGPLLAMLGSADAIPDGTGALTASATVAGRLDRPLASSGVVTLAQLVGELRSKPLTLSQPGRVRFDGRQVTVEEPLRMTLGGLSIGLAPRAGAPAGGVVATLEGRIEEGLDLLAPDIARTPWRVEGPVRADVSLKPEGDRFAISGSTEVTLERVMRESQELARAVRIRAQIGGGAIDISEVVGTVLGGPFSGAGRVPVSWAFPSAVAQVLAGRDAEPLEASASARANVTLSRTLPGLAGMKEDVSGSAKIAIEARATAPSLTDLDVTMAVEASELAINEVRLVQQRPATLRWNTGQLEVRDLAWKAPRSQLTASGAIGLLPGAEGEFRAQGTSSLTFLRSIAAGTAGEAAFQLRLSGPPGARRTSATVDVKDVSVIEPERHLALAGLSGRLTLEADILEAHGLRGQLNGGELTIDGTVPLRSGVAAPRPLKVEGRGLFVEIPRGLRSQVDTSVTWEHASAGSRLSGQVAIASDKYREPITALASLAASLSNVSPARARTLPPWVAATALDIRLTSVGPLVVDQSVLRLEMVPDLQLTGTVGRPSLSGQVAIQDDGRVQAGGRTYRLTDSRLEFSPATGLLPRLNVIGETRVSSYSVTLRMTGPANEIETNFSSDPPLSERDVQSLLITGQTADPTRRSTESDRFAIGAVSGDVLGVAGQFVGFDSVRVGTEDLDLVSSDVNPSTRLTVSKRLGSRFELVLSENLEESESTWIVIYRPVSGYEFRLSSEDNTTQALEFRQEITFGPGVSTRARVRSVALVADRVQAVTVVGDPGFPADQILGGTKIRAGDRFDFREWLEDRDRIARFYTDQGYFAARIVPMRTAGEATSGDRPVDLQYRITRGQRTLLEFTGYSADDELRERLRRTWSETVLLDLLDDSLERAVREHLIDDGFLRARIEVRVDQPEPGAVRARLSIEPGPRTGSRLFAFSGNQIIPSESLQELASSNQLDADPWKDPGPLMAAIQAAYAAKGHLTARATAGTIEFSNGTATLSIQVEEGPPTRVASIDLTGVASERRSGALAAVALPVGSPFASGMGRAGRTRLERYYRDLGYRDVRVEVTGKAAPRASEVSLTYAVHEGPLHVVRSVEIAGVQSTRESLVNDAVRLTAGDPAGAAAAASTERRLYDLGTFRRAEIRFEPEPATAAAPGIVPVKAVVALEEARRFQLRYGVEVSSEYSSALSQRTNAWGFAADIRDRNFLGRGMSLGGGLRYEPDLRSARGLFSVPKLANRPIRTTVYLTARAEEETVEQQVRVRDDEVEAAVEQRMRVGRAVEYSWGYSANRRDTQLISATSAEPLAFTGTLASLNGAIVIDRRDSLFDAKRGWFGSASLQYGERALASDLDYLRTLVRGSYYQPVGGVVLAGNLRWGRLLPLGGVPPLTVFDLFFNAGGTETVRGYSQDKLSAYEFFGAPLGGTKLLVGNAELRAPLFWRFGAVLFADAGNTFAEQQQVRFRDLAVGLGLGLRINTPLAPVRIDLGFPRRSGESGPRLHFSIGQMF